MPTVFDEQFAASAFSGLLDQFGEPLLYLPCPGQPRLITAIIDREPPAILDGSGNAVMPSAILQVVNSRRTGIARLELDIGRDQVEFALKVGCENKTKFSLMVLQSSSGGITVIAVR